MHRFRARAGDEMFCCEDATAMVLPGGFLVPNPTGPFNPFYHEFLSLCHLICQTHQ